MKILVSGGRTGGHLIPGIAIYEELKRNNVITKYALSVFDLNYQIVERIKEEDRILVDLKNISRKLSHKTPIYLLKIFFAFLKVFRKVKDFNPDKVIITGGYISNPIALSALILRKPLYIVEQNSVAGATNRMYARFAKKIFIAMPFIEKLPMNKTVFTGNPSIYYNKVDEKLAKKFFELEDYKNVILITGGSQGASIINDSILSILEYLKEKNIGVIWSVGAVDYERLYKEGFIEEINKKFLNVKTFKFIANMDYAFSSANIVISRAGATTISELIYYQVPSILIPIKNSPDNHQFKNAKFLKDNHCAEILEEDDLDDYNLKQYIELILDKNEYYKENLKKLNKALPEKGAAKEIVNILLNS